MKTNQSRKQLAALLLLFVSLQLTVSCKEISVSDDTLDRIDNIFDQNTSGETDTENDAENDTTDSTATETIADESNSDNNEDDGDSEIPADLNDPSGGLEYWPESRKGSNRTFLGTWEIKKSYTTCDNTYWGPGLEVPGVLRGYAHGTTIDWETSLDQLVWSAEIYEDDTFDFQVNYLDYYGNPSITLTCTCAIDEYEWYDDTLDCTCQPSNDNESCSIYYEIM